MKYDNYVLRKYLNKGALQPLSKRINIFVVDTELPLSLWQRIIFCLLTAFQEARFFPVRFLIVLCITLRLWKTIP